MAAQSIDRSLEISEATCAACNQDFPARPGVSICALCRAPSVREPVPAAVAAAPSPAVPPAVIAAPAVLAAVAAVIAAPGVTPAGCNRRPGVDVGCGRADCPDCYTRAIPTPAGLPVLMAGWVPMMARFASRCPGCDSEIRRGDSICYSRERKEARHDRCAPRSVAAAPNPFAPVAPEAAPAPRMTSVRPGSAEAYIAANPGAVNIMDMVAPPAPTPRAFDSGAMARSILATREAAAAVGPRDPATLWERVPARETVPVIPPDRTGVTPAMAAWLDPAPGVRRPAAREVAIENVPYRRPPAGTASAEVTPPGTVRREAPAPIAPAAVTTALAGMASRHGWVVTPDESGALGLDVRMDPLDGKVVTVAQIADAWAAADLPASWLLGAASPVASLGRAVAQLRRGGAIVTSEGSHEGVWNVEARIVGARVGEASRVKTLTVSLAPAGALRFEPSDHPGRAAVEDAYAEARAGRLDTSQLRRWVDALIFDRLAGTTSGHAHRFIPIAGSPVWARVEAAVNTAMGSPEGGIFVAIPMASIKSLTVRVRAGILANAEEAIKKAEADLEAAAADDGALGTASARSSLDKIAAAGAQLDSYALVIGDQPECKARLAQLRDQLARHARDARGRGYRPDAVERMAGVWDELRREAAKSDVPAPAGEGV